MQLNEVACQHFAATKESAELISQLSSVGTHLTAILDKGHGNVLELRSEVREGLDQLKEIRTLTPWEELNRSLVQCSDRISALAWENRQHIEDLRAVRESDLQLLRELQAGAAEGLRQLTEAHEARKMVERELQSAREHSLSLERTLSSRLVKVAAAFSELIKSILPFKSEKK